MTSQLFLKFIHDPGLVNDQSLQLLEDLASQYPYCQSGQLLLACNLFVEDDTHYPDQLKKAAAYAGDRRVLKALIGSARKSSDTKPQITFIPESEIRIADSPARRPDQEYRKQITENSSVTYERMTQEELLAIVKKRLAEIEAEKKGEPIISDIPHPDSEMPHSIPRIPHPTSPVTKDYLIEKFIKDEPRISKPKATFFNPTDSAIRSNFDDEEIVSETLARLYAEQGNLQKAVHIYQKLSLINQEKSRYFAAQIEKLNS